MMNIDFMGDFIENEMQLFIDVFKRIIAFWHLFLGQRKKANHKIRRTIANRLTQSFRLAIPSDNDVFGNEILFRIGVTPKIAQIEQLLS